MIRGRSKKVIQDSVIQTGIPPHLPTLSNNVWNFFKGFLRCFYFCLIIVCIFGNNGYMCRQAKRAPIHTGCSVMAVQYNLDAKQQIQYT